LDGKGFRTPFLVFVGEVRTAKTASGVFDWAPDECCAQWRLSPQALDLGLPEARPAEAVKRGARSLLIGAAPLGGGLPASWIPALLEAIEAGLDIVSGLHARLSEISEIAVAARRHGRALHEIRRDEGETKIASGRRRTGRRLLTVGTDCGVGKKYTSLAISHALRARGISTTFRATGQTGMLIAGSGIAIDAVVSDFVAGAAERLSPDAPEDHWDVIEGQGAILHPAYAAVTLGLLHGSQPDVLVMCHDPTRTEIASFPGFPIRPLPETMELYLALARVTNPDVRFAAVSLNTSKLEEPDARRIAADMTAAHGLPCFDPLRFGLAEALPVIIGRR
jgi:uncharacterized NAD-dependent epimerase/dehydratase family protein